MRYTFPDITVVSLYIEEVKFPTLSRTSGLLAESKPHQNPTVSPLCPAGGVMGTDIDRCIACVTSTATQEKPDWRYAETFENRVLVVHETCTVDWDHSKETWSLREVWLLPGSRASQQPVTILAFYFSDSVHCSWYGITSPVNT